MIEKFLLEKLIVKYNSSSLPRCARSLSLSRYARKLDLPPLSLRSKARSPSSLATLVRRLMCWDYSDCVKCDKRTWCISQCDHTDEEIDNGRCDHRDCKSFERCYGCSGDLCEDCDRECGKCRSSHCEECGCGNTMYVQRRQTYSYLISFMILHIHVSPIIVVNEQWLFFGP